LLESSAQHGLPFDMDKDERMRLPARSADFLVYDGAQT
jgi:hypothetical protein